MKLGCALVLVTTLSVSAQAPEPVDVRLVTALGDIVVAVDTLAAPTTAKNFVEYVRAGHYDGGSFFRTVRRDNQPDSPVKIDVVQAGVHPWMDNFAREPIPLERTSETGLAHLDGAVSMARGGPDTATSSFFICVGDQPELDFGGRRNPDGQGFAVFGQVIEGMDVVHRIHRHHAVGQALMPPVQILQAEVE